MKRDAVTMLDAAVAGSRILASTLAFALLVGCGKREEQVPANAAPVQKAAPVAVAPPATPASVAAVEPPVPPTAEPPAKLSETMPAGQAKAQQVAKEVMEEALLKTGKELGEVVKQMYEIEAAARQANSDVKAAYEQLLAARTAYDLKVNALPGMADLEKRKQEIEKTYRQQAERRDQMAQQKREKP